MVYNRDRLIKFEYNIKLIVVPVVADRDRVDSNLQEIVIVVRLSNMGQKMLIVPFWAVLVSFSHFGYIRVCGGAFRAYL